MNTHKKLSLREKIRNLFKNEWGSSTCYYCGGAWNWKKSHDVKVDENGGFFICCDECWNEMSLQEKLEAFDYLYFDAWKENSVLWSYKICRDAIIWEDSKKK